MKQYLPQAEFPYFKKACEMFEILETTCFTYGEVCYTNYFPLSPDLVIHERHHTKQQNAIGKDLWWDKFFIDPEFRLQQELECYRKQIASIKDRNERFRLHLFCIDILSGPMYGNCVSKEELVLLLK